VGKVGANEKVRCFLKKVEDKCANGEQTNDRQVRDKCANGR